MGIGRLETALKLVEAEYVLTLGKRELLKIFGENLVKANSQEKRHATRKSVQVLLGYLFLSKTIIMLMINLMIIFFI